MATQYSTVDGAFTPQDFGQLVNLAVKRQSIAGRSASHFGTDAAKVTFPRWTANPAVAMYNELEQIALTDATTDHVDALVYKTAAINLISNEMADDSNPSVAELIGAGLAENIARKIDACYLANTTAKGPDGLLAQSYTAIDNGGAAFTSLDPFIAARYAAEANGSKLTHWIVSPATAEVLSKIKVQSGSQLNLLQFVDDGIEVAGLPVLLSNQIDAGTLAWGIPKEHVQFVLRKDTEVRKFDAVREDGVYIRAVARFGFAFLNEPGITRIYDVTP
ncbi:capsid protein [Mycobacteroides immunogenum]|uniref:Capsid protein n=1 Tax=Mycobacteroides immunogenum TaxID=83262 RepID=A0A179VEM0_9MYCO|nr:phage major capsid protein [Mycobacteroides immunogenum]OAT69435.1 capsid protein [Mycobacteroides immunogenum]